MSEAGERTSKRIVVVGGGVSGLAAAHRLMELAGETGSGIEVHLREARDRLGGSMVTHRRDGFVIEAGPDSFITDKPWALRLCHRLGLTRELIPTNPSCRRTFVVHGGVLHPIPEGFLLLAPSRLWPFVTSGLFSWRGKLRMGLDLILPGRDHGRSGDESLGSFVRRRFGAEALERIAQPLAGGIYAADPERLSLRATMPRFLDMEAKHRSLILAMRRRVQAAARNRGEAADSGARYSMFVSLAGGMGRLVETLQSRLPAGAVCVNAPVSRLRREPAGWRVVLANGSSERADGVVLACPAQSSAQIVRGLDGPLADELSVIEYASSATMSLAFRRDQVGHGLDGFGFVVPASQKRSVMAVTFSSVKFAGRAPDGWVLMRAFLGGALQPEVYELDDDTLRQAVLGDLGDLIGVEGRPAFVELYRWPGSMPQYPVGHLDRVRRIEARLANWPGLQLAGNAFGGVGIPDCVHSGERAAQRLVELLTGRRRAGGVLPPPMG